MVQLSRAQQGPLQKAARSTSGSVRFAQRAKIIVLDGGAAGRLLQRISELLAHPEKL